MSKKNKQSLSVLLSCFSKACLCFFSCVFPYSSWLSSLYETILFLCGVYAVMSTRSLFYSPGVMVLLSVMKRAYCSTIPTAVSAMDVKAFEFLKWFSTTSCNKWICNCIYHRCASGCFPSESKQCAILSEHKIIPRGLCRTKSQTYCIAEIWNKHDAQCQRCQCMHGGRKIEQEKTRGGLYN